MTKKLDTHTKAMNLRYKAIRMETDTLVKEFNLKPEAFYAANTSLAIDGPFNKTETERTRSLAKAIAAYLKVTKK